MDDFVHLTHFEGKLYRYQPYVGEYVEFVNDLILNNRIYYSNPLQFNDPFDCKMYGIKFSEERVERFMRERFERGMALVEMIQPRTAPLPKEVKCVFLEESVKKNSPKTLEGCAQVIQGLHDLVEKEIGVLCLSSDPMNILMYSHYADRHRGVCLEFTLQQDNIFNPEPVRYVRDFPTLDFGLSHDVNKALAVALIATKSKDWEYEQEYRSLRGGGAGVIEIPDNYLSGIIFGCAASDETVQTVMDVVKQSGKTLSLSKAVKSDSSFSLSIEEM